MPINFHQGQDIGRRDEQQDALGNLLLNAHAKLYVLADGMGGHQGGRLASTTVVDAFLAFFQGHGDETDWPALLPQALASANRALAEQRQAQPGLAGMGTTVVAVVVDEAVGRYHYISVGDSPLYLLRSGRLQRINANHAFAEDLKKLQAAGEISAEEAASHPARHAVTSAVMGEDIPHTDHGCGDFNAGEWLLLASDGVQTLSDAEGGEIEAILAAAGSAEDKIGRLLAAVKARQLPAQDNTSLLLVQAAAATPSPAPTTVLAQMATAERPARRNRWLPVLAGMVLGGVLAFWWWSRPQAVPVVPVDMPASSVGLPVLPASTVLPPASEAEAGEAASDVEAASAPRIEAGLRIFDTGQPAPQL